MNRACAEKVQGRYAQKKKRVDDDKTPFHEISQRELISRPGSSPHSIE